MAITLPNTLIKNVLSLVKINDDFKQNTDYYNYHATNYYNTFVLNTPGNLDLQTHTHTHKKKKKQALLLCLPSFSIQTIDSINKDLKPMSIDSIYFDSFDISVSGCRIYGRCNICHDGKIN